MRRPAGALGSGLAVGFALAALLLVPTLLLAHLALRTASPGPGESLTRAPESIHLHFTEPVELPLSTLRMTGPEGPTPLGPLETVGSRDVVVAAILGHLVAGTYTVAWQAVGRDGHPVRGEFGFEIQEGAEGLAPLEPVATVAAEAASPPPPPTPPVSDFDSRSPLYAAVRWMVYAGVMGMLGAIGFAVLVLMRLPRGAVANGLTLDRGLRGAATLGALASLLLVVSVPLRLQAQSHALFGAGITGERMGMLLSSTWGIAWVIQALAVPVALAGFVLARRFGAAAWGAAALGTLAITVTPALSGHAAAAEPSPLLAIAADSLHVAGSGLWLGTLLALFLVGIPLLRNEPEGQRGATLNAMVRTFSPLALVAGALVAATGLFAAWLNLAGPADLWRTEYGRLLVAKLLFVAVIFTMGAVNWRRVQPRVAEPGGDRRLRRTASVELAATLLVLAITSLLTAVPPPARDGGAPTLTEVAIDE